MAYSEQLMVSGSGSGSGSGSMPRYVQMQTEPSGSIASSLISPRPDATPIFDELPEATIVSVSRPDAGDFSPMLLTYTIEFQYKQVRSLSLSLTYFFSSMLQKFHSALYKVIDRS